VQLRSQHLLRGYSLTYHRSRHHLLCAVEAPPPSSSSSSSSSGSGVNVMNSSTVEPVTHLITSSKTTRGLWSRRQPRPSARTLAPVDAHIHSANYKMAAQCAVPASLDLTRACKAAVLLYIFGLYEEKNSTCIVSYQIRMGHSQQCMFVITIVIQCAVPDWPSSGHLRLRGCSMADTHKERHEQ